MDLRFTVVLAFLVGTLIEFANTADYCKIQSCQRRPHTVCIFTSPKPSSRCTGYQGSGLTRDEKEKILNLHNQLRQRVANGREKRGQPGPQPAAKQMPKLVWDNELESIAQRWANQCIWGHDKCRDVERFRVGQNVAVIGTTGNVKTIKVDTMVSNWYNEVKDFSRHEVSRFRGSSGKMIGHYTQMLWAKTTSIGCGATKYKDGKFNKFYLVCNYGPTGNILGQPLYAVR